MTETVTFSLIPADNVRLANLCGAMDENISHIARTLSVKIRRRGEQFRLDGNAAPLAADAIKTLYSRADSDIGVDEVRLHLAKKLQTAEEAVAAAAAAPATGRGSFVARTAAQQTYWDKLHAARVTLCTGPAGTGKTHVAVAAALRLMEETNRQGAPGRLVLSRPVVEAGGERLGFLPGDMEQKINPYLRPLYEALYDMLGRQETERRMARGEIEILPLAFMRGLTLNNTILILDEAQNTTPEQMKMLLTRLGQNGKIIVTGDTTQSDLPTVKSSGLADAVGRLEKLTGVACHHFSRADIIRHPLVRDILRAYEDS